MNALQTPRFGLPAAGASRMRAFAVLACIVWLLLNAGCSTTGAGGASRSESSVVPATPNESEERRRARIRLELATGYYQQRNYNVALDELRLALEADPDYAPAYGMLGLIYMDLRENDKAQQSFQRGLQILPNDSELNNNYGWYLCRTGHEKESIEYFLKATRNPLYATPARPLHNAGICALKSGDSNAAENYFQQSFQADPRNPVALYQLADLYLHRGEPAKARIYVQRLSNMYEPNAETLWLALRIERKLGNREAESRLAVQLRRRFPQSREAALMLAGQFDQ